MDTTQRLIVTLMKAAVTGESQPLPEGYSLEEAMPIIKKQGLATLAYEGGVKCGISRKDPNMQELFRLYYQILLHSERQMQKVEEIYKAFEENGIDYLPFKGCVLKSLYPRPELRPMGDADILIRFEQYPRICFIMEKLGFSMEVETQCEQVWGCKDLHVELHKCMVQPLNRDYYAYFGDGWSRAVHEQGFRYGFSPEDTYIHLFAHYAKHYRGAGIGCRHALDLWAYWMFNPNLNTEYLNEEFKKLRLEVFHENTLKMLDCWFAAGAADAVAEYMTRHIFSGGAFGNVMGFYLFKELAQAKNSDNVQHAKVAFALRLFFPSLGEIRRRYRIVNRFPFLLPFGWIARWIEILLLHRERISKAMKVGSNISNDSLSAHQEALRFVGLDFHDGVADEIRQS